MAIVQERYLLNTSQCPNVSERSNTLLKVREMLESVRHRVSSVTCNYGSSANLSEPNRSIGSPDDSIGSESLNLSRRSSMRSDVVPADSVSSSILLQIQSIQFKLNSLANTIADLKRESDKELEITGDKISQTFLLDQLKNLYELESNIDFLKIETVKNLKETRKRLDERPQRQRDSFYLQSLYHNATSKLSDKIDTKKSDLRHLEAPKQYKMPANSLRRSNTINPRLIRTRQARHSIGGLQLTTHSDDDQANLKKVPEESYDGRSRNMTTTPRGYV